MASVPCKIMLLLATLAVILASCYGRPEPPEYTSYFTSTTSIRVEWSPGTDDGGGTVNGFRLHYKLENGKMKKLKVPESPFTYDIQGLKEACGNYQIRMATTASTGLSRYSSFAQVDRVVSAPQNLNVVASSGSSARATWSPPPNSACISGYQLGFGLDENSLRTMMVPADLTQYILADLQPGSSYLLTLAATAGGEIGEEAYSQWYQAGPPSPPANLRANPSSPTTAVVSWSPTASGITHYTYLYGPAGIPDNKMSEGNVGPASMVVEINDLEPGLEYQMKVSAVSAVGQSEATTVTWLQPAPALPKVPEVDLPAAPRQVLVRSTSPQTAIVSWTAPEGDLKILGYIVGFGLVGSPDRDLVLTSVALDELAYELEGLKVGRQYKVQVQAYNNDGDGEMESAVWQQEDVPVQLSVPTQPRGVLAYSSSPTSIDISWMLSELTEPVDGFRVAYGSGPSADEFSIVVDGNSDSVEIQELKPDSLYYMKLYAFNAAGRSGPVTRSVQTLDLPPEERCTRQQEQCTQNFQPLPTGAGSVCTSILQYLNCLQLLRDTCMHDAGYQGRVGSVRDMFLRESCNRNPRSPARGAVVPGPAIPGPAVPEVIPAPTNLQSTLLSPTSAQLTWFDETLGESQVINDNRFYNIQYRITDDDRYLEVRTRELSYIVDSLLPGVQYEFTVQLILDSQRRSPLSDTLNVMSRDPAYGAIPERFTILQVTVSSPTTAKALLNWLPPPQRGPPMEYIIEYTDSEEFRDPVTVWERLTFPGSQLSAVINGLTSDLEYHARITAVFSPTEMGPKMASPTSFTTPVIPPSPNVGKQCDETEEEGVTRRVNFLWNDVVDGQQRPPLYGVPIPYCDDAYSVEECHGIFCFCIPGKKPPALRQSECSANLPPCRREYDMARKALDEARLKGMPPMSAMLPHCRDDGYYHPKQCSGTMCYCVTENGAHTGQEKPMWANLRLRCA